MTNPVKTNASRSDAPTYPTTPLSPAALDFALQQLTGSKPANPAPASRSSELQISATPAAATIATMNRVDIPTKRFKFYVEIGRNKFEVNADIPEALIVDGNIDAAQKFWTDQLRYIAEVAPKQLPAPYETHNMLVDETSLTVVKNGQEIVFKDEVAEICKHYAKGEREKLLGALANFEAFELTSDSPTFNAKPPVAIEHETGKNTCYLAAATQALMNDPKLLQKLPRAAYTEQDSKKKLALAAIEALVKTYNSGKPVPGSEMIKLRKALASIDSEFNNEQQQDVDEAFRVMETLILENSTAEPDVVFITKTDSGEISEKPDRSNGYIGLPLPETQSLVPLATLLDGLKDRKFLKSPDRLDITLGRYPQGSTTTKKITTPVQLPAEFEMQSSLYLETSPDRSYELSTVILHQGAKTNEGHYQTLVRKLGVDGTFRNYLCDDMASEKVKELSQNEFADLLQSPNIYKAIYTKKEKLNTATSRARRSEARKAAAETREEGEKATSAPAPSPTPAPITPEVELLVAKETGEDKGIIQPLKNFSIVKGTVEGQDAKTVLVNFTTPDYSNVDQRIRKVVQETLQTSWYNLTPKTAITTDNSRTTIHINPGSTQKDLRKAVNAALKTAKGKVAIPLPKTAIGLDSQTIYNTIVDAAVQFAAKTPTLEIKILLTEEQEKSIALAGNTTASSKHTLISKEAIDTANAPVTLTTEKAYEPKPLLVASGAAQVAGLVGLNSVQDIINARTKWKPIHFKAVKYKEIPELSTEHYPVVPNIDPRIYKGGELPKPDSYTGDFNVWIKDALEAKKTKIAIALKLDKDKEVNWDLTQQRFENWINQLSSHPTFKDGLITDIELMVLPPETK